jgi:bacterioferritin
MAERQRQDVSDCLRGIAIVEMHHLELLGEYINRLGLYPTYSFYQGTRRMRWNSGFVCYGRNLRDMLDSDIAAETKAIEGYERDIRSIPDPVIQSLLRRIIEDEEIHVKALTDLRQTL